MKTAIVYDRVNKWGGAERVLLALHEIFPDAPLFTSVYDENKAPWAKVFPNVYTSFLQKFPLAKGNHEIFAPFMPIAFESFNFDEYDLVISVTSEAAKGIITKPSTKHICYMLTPTRYLWSQYDLYFRNPILKLFSKPIVNYLKNWDKIAANRPDKIVAISNEVKSRVKQYYRKDVEVIFPSFQELNTKKEYSTNGKYFLVVSRLVPYKRVDLAIKVFSKLGLPLYIVGSGWEEIKLRLIARRNVKFFGHVSEERLKELYKGAKALIMPQVEEFGLESVEAQSFGVPVIALGKGGALDTVIDGKTGLLFPEQTIESLKAAIEKFQKMSFNYKSLANNAKKNSFEIFRQNFKRFI